MSATRRHAAWLLRAALTALVVAFLVRQIDPGAATAHLRAAPPWVFVAPALLLLVNALVHATRVRLLLGGLGEQVSLWLVLRALLVGWFIGAVTPRGGGEVARLAVLSRSLGSMDPALAALVTARLLELLVWLSLIAGGMTAGLAGDHPLIAAGATAFSFAAGASLIAVVMGARWGPSFTRRLPLFSGPLTRMASAFQEMSRAPRALAAALALTAPVCLINVASVWTILQGYGVPMPYLEVLRVLPAADTAIALPVTIGGLGIREGVFAVMLAPLGVPAATAVAIGLTRWIAELLRSAVGGVVFLLDR